MEEDDKLLYGDDGGGEDDATEEPSQEGPEDSMDAVNFIEENSNKAAEEVGFALPFLFFVSVRLLFFCRTTLILKTTKRARKKMSMQTRTMMKKMRKKRILMKITFKSQLTTEKLRKPSRATKTLGSNSLLDNCRAKRRASSMSRTLSSRELLTASRFKISSWKISRTSPGGSQVSYSLTEMKSSFL